MTTAAQPLGVGGDHRSPTEQRGQTGSAVDTECATAPQSPRSGGRADIEDSVGAQLTNAETPKAMARNSTIRPRSTATPNGMTDIRVAGTARVTA